MGSKRLTETNEAIQLRQRMGISDIGFTNANVE